MQVFTQIIFDTIRTPKQVITGHSDKANLIRHFSMHLMSKNDSSEK